MIIAASAVIYNPVFAQTCLLCHPERSRARGEAKPRNLQYRNQRAAIKSLDSVPLSLHFIRDDRAAMHFSSFRIWRNYSNGRPKMRFTSGMVCYTAFSSRIWRTQVCAAFTPRPPGRVQGAGPLVPGVGAKSPHKKRAEQRLRVLLIHYFSSRSLTRAFSSFMKEGISVKDRYTEAKRT